MKTMIVVSASGNKGKTHTIMAAARLFPLSDVEYLQYYADAPATGLNPSWVLCRGKYAVGETEKNVGFSSEGDTFESVHNGLVALTHDAVYPDVIVLACRTRGASRGAVEDFAAQHSYALIWTSTYYGVTPAGSSFFIAPNGVDLNGVFAQNIVELVKRLLS